ncbi:hypothetical protein [Microcoleus sp. MON2_D5]|uniref:hypothetical protein n=1 Tax=Microcoleus sp. MON2_D5 TaxID=2818833 RepID=UPI002FD2BBA2
MENIFYIRVSVLISTTLLYQALLTQPASAKLTSNTGSLDNISSDISLLQGSLMSPLYPPISTYESPSKVLVAGNSSEYIDNGGYATKDEFLKAQDYQPSSDYASPDEKYNPVPVRPSIPLRLGIPYFLNPNTVCREQGCISLLQIYEKSAKMKKLVKL